MCIHIKAVSAADRVCMRVNMSSSRGKCLGDRTWACSLSPLCTMVWTEEMNVSSASALLHHDVDEMALFGPS